MNQTSSEWQARTTTAKGNLGEGAVSAWLIEKGWVPYRPDPSAGAHPFDWLLARPDKRHIMIADAKTKEARTHYPDTGINEKHLKDYQRLSRKHRMPVFLFFVDSMMACVYGNYLRTLCQPYTAHWNGGQERYPKNDLGRTGRIVYFPLDLMVPIAELTPAQCEEIWSSSTRSIQYYPSNRWRSRLGQGLSQLQLAGMAA